MKNLSNYIAVATFFYTFFCVNLDAEAQTIIQRKTKESINKKTYIAINHVGGSDKPIQSMLIESLLDNDTTKYGYYTTRYHYRDEDSFIVRRTVLRNNDFNVIWNYMNDSLLLKNRLQSAKNNMAALHDGKIIHFSFHDKVHYYSIVFSSKSNELIKLRNSLLKLSAWLESTPSLSKDCKESLSPQINMLITCLFK
ncbi:MAG: hypothetical protein M3Y54_07300 [Bacteroidota bacterium]|nr:hypothetical protein [Bacteroidota bacterium]